MTSTADDPNGALRSLTAADDEDPTLERLEIEQPQNQHSPEDDRRDRQGDIDQQVDDHPSTGSRIGVNAGDRRHDDDDGQHYKDRNAGLVK